MKANVIAITGGIGSGKTLISKILLSLGYYIYNCDVMAKTIMDNNKSIKIALVKDIDKSVINSDNSINRKRLAEIVFNDPLKLEQLNKIVHKFVKDDIKNWIVANKLKNNKKPIFIETAILYQSGIDKLVDEVWEVVASEETRINRVIKRNGISRNEIKSRISSQQFEPNQKHYNTKIINNDLNYPVLAQIMALL